MKIINSFIPCTSNTNVDIKNWQALGLALSSVLSRKHYKDVELYTSKIMLPIFEELNLPFTKINVVEDSLIENIGQITVPKVAVMSIQKESFTHIDFDTFLYHKLDESKLNNITFSHADIGTISRIDHLCGVYDSYGFMFQQMREKLPWWYYDVDVREIPNMNLVHVPTKDLEVFKQACNEALSYYYEHKETWDQHYPSGIAVEQLGIHTILKHRGINTELYFNHVPSAISADEKTYNFSTYSSHTDRGPIEIDLENNIEALDTEDFGGYVHTGSYWLMNIGSQKMCKYKLQQEGYGDVVERIEKLLGRVGE